MPIGEARAGLTGMVRAFRADPERAEAVVLGARRVPEAVLLPYARYREISARVEAGAGADARTRVSTTIGGEVQRRAALIRRLARANRLGEVAVFGSVARGDDRPGSDLDLLITPDPGATLFDIAQFELDVESLIGVPVQAVSRRALDPQRDARVLAEAVPL